MKKKLLFLFAFLTFSMAACGKADTASSGEPSSDAIAQESEDSFASEAAESGKPSVADQYEIGDIILADGSAVKAADLTAVDADNMPIAVIAGFEEDGAAFGVGLRRSGEPLQWEADETDGTEDTENYPAFYFVDTYAEVCGLTGDSASGWYMPDIGELCMIYQNQDAVDVSLQKIYELDNNASMSGLGSNWYWSSSQSESEEDYAWFVHYLNGYTAECPKNFTNVHVVAVRKF